MECALRYILSLCLVVLVGRILPGLYEFIVSIVTLGATLYIAKHATCLLKHWIPVKRLYPGNKAVFITGCDTGFGHESAKRLHKLGFQVFAGCLFPTAEGATKLQKSCPSNLKIVPLDVTNEECIEVALQMVKDELKEKDLWALVNIAGIGPVGELEFCSLKNFKEAYDVNSLGVVRVTQAFLPLIRKSKGRIVTIASIAGRISVAGSIAYSMSKHAAVSFSEGLRLEMKKWGVKVISIEPWIYRTNIVARDVIENKLNKAWEEAPEYVREDYGTRYFEDLKNKTFKFIDTANLNIYEVIDCVENSLLDEVPQRYYRPANSHFKVFFWVAKFLPQCFTDFMLMRNYASETPAMFFK